MFFSLVETGTSWADALDKEESSTTEPCRRNRFDALDEPQADGIADEHNEMLNSMNNFAHRIQLGKKQAQKRRKPKEDIDAVLKEFGYVGPKKTGKDMPIFVQQARDLDSPEVRRLVKPLPDDPEQINRLAKLCPKDEGKLKPGEMWMLWDTGASCNTMKVARDCPQYSHLVTPTKASSSGHGAESACGGSIKERGEVVIDMLVDGEPSNANKRYGCEHADFFWAMLR